MLKPLILAAAAFTTVVPTQVLAQFVDEAVQKRGSEIAEKLKAWLEPQLPTKSDPWVMNHDGRIFSTILELPGDTDLLALGKLAGSDAKEASAAMEAWASTWRRRLPLSRRLRPIQTSTPRPTATCWSAFGAPAPRANPRARSPTTSRAHASAPGGTSTRGRSLRRPKANPPGARSRW